MPELKSAFADSLLMRRTKKRWSQKQLAEVSGVSVDAIGLYERCVCSPNLETVVKLAEALGCTPNDLCKFPEIK